MDSISEEEMKIYLYFLASDQLEGRNLPSRGFDTAALYVASHLAEWGLKPGGSTAKTNGPLQPYLMPFELVSKQVVPEQSKASITAPPAAGGRGGRGGGGGGGARGGAASTTPRTTDFEYTKDWTVNAGGRGAPPLEALDVTGNLVFAGNGYVINKTKINPYEGLDVKGKIIVVAGLPAELAAQQAAGGGRGGGGRAARHSGAGCGARARQRSRRSAAESSGRGVHRFSDARTIRGEEWRARRGHHRQLPAAHRHGQSQRRRRFGGFGGGGGGGRADSTGPPIRCPNSRRPPACPSVPSITAGLAMTNSIFQGEKQSAQQIFYAAGSNAKAGFLRTDRGEEDQPEGGAQERDQSRAKTSSAFSRAATRC